MDMSFVFMISMGFLTCVMVSGVVQPVTAVATRRGRDNTTQR